MNSVGNTDGVLVELTSDMDKWRQEGTAYPVVLGKHGAVAGFVHVCNLGGVAEDSNEGCFHRLEHGAMSCTQRKKKNVIIRK